MSLTKNQTEILRLIKRSKSDEDGWYRVSGMIWPLVKSALPADLADTKPLESGGLIRFTDRGQAVADYL